MSLDVYLEYGEPLEVINGGIFIREDGQTKEISIDEWNRRNPDREPIIAIGTRESCEVFSANITHNLGEMAKDAGIYQHLWRPDEISITHARELIGPLTEGLALMKSDPVRFEKHNPENGWGTYKMFVPWIEAYLRACIQYPDATVRVSR